jgi:hypothetical protein
MEAVIIKHNFTAGKTLKEIITTFFKDNTPESTQVLFWKFFQCWVSRDCKIKADLTDEEVALFFDQLIDLVAAAHIVHQANRASNVIVKEEDDHA